MVSHDGFERKIGIGFVLECYRRLLTLMCIYCNSRKRPRRVLLRKALPSKTAEVMAVLKDCHQRLPK